MQIADGWLRLFRPVVTSVFQPLNHSPSCFFGRMLIAECYFGGADRDRTGDLLLAKQALSQLSYSPHK